MELDELYERFEEDKRLNSNNAYSIYYANSGYHVTAIEPVKRNIDIIKSKIISEAY